MKFIAERLCKFVWSTKQKDYGTCFNETCARVLDYIRLSLNSWLHQPRFAENVIDCKQGPKINIVESLFLWVWISITIIDQTKDTLIVFSTKNFVTSYRRCWILFLHCSNCNCSQSFKILPSWLNLITEIIWN